LLGLYSATPKKGHSQERLSQKWNIPETLIFEELFQWISMSLKIEITILLHFEYLKRISRQRNIVCHKINF
jgi:hypothetical protein